MTIAKIDNATREFFTAAELACRWGVHVVTVRREVKRKRLRGTVIGGQIRFAADEVARYEEQ
jgi:excisionase family DNA binding protein